MVAKYAVIFVITQVFFFKLLQTSLERKQAQKRKIMLNTPNLKHSTSKSVYANMANVL